MLVLGAFCQAAPGAPELLESDTITPIMDSNRAKVVVDTNIFDQAAKNRRRPDWVQKLADDDLFRGQIEIIIVDVVQMELDRHTSEAIRGAEQDIKKAVKALERYEIEVDTETADLRASFSVIEDLRSAGFTVSVRSTTLEDYQNALRLSAQKLPPLTGSENEREQTKDLTIWSAALSVARDNGGAYLVARDGIFWSTDESVRAELRDASLRRFRSMTDLSGIVSRQYAPVLDLLMELSSLLIKTMGVPMNNPPSWSSISVNTMTLKNGEVSHLDATARADRRSEKDGPLDLAILFSCDSGRQARLEVTCTDRGQSVALKETAIEFEHAYSATDRGTDSEERLRSLRALIKEGD